MSTEPGKELISRSPGERRILRGLVAAVVLIVVAVWFFLPIFVADLPRANFQRDLKKRISPEELHAWGMRVLAPFQTNMPDDNAVTDLPPALHDLGEGKPRAYIFADTPDAVPYMRVVYGSAAGHYGVEIAPTNRSKPVSPSRHYTLWVPGVWFFDGQ